MEFPDEIVSIIKEFSMPITRPDWKTLHRMPHHTFHHYVAYSFNRYMHQCLYELALRHQNDYHIQFEHGIPYLWYFY